MRQWMLAFAALCLSALPAHAAGIQTGQDLVNACNNYLVRSAGEDNNAARAPHPCRSFLQGFFVSLIERENARQDAMVRGLPYSSKDQCVRVPDFLSYTEMARRLINFAQYNPASLPQPASRLAQQTMERDFPCPQTNSR
jgi:hypothetical protein